MTNRVRRAIIVGAMFGMSVVLVLAGSLLVLRRHQVWPGWLALIYFAGALWGMGLALRSREPR